ncbi:MAG: UPF0262 family protein, partial [Methylobacteriaceae bacterium]|nr:UPF0262 family protein [Methylobacteriaceae bacterium]
MSEPAPPDDRRRLVAIVLDEASLAAAGADQEHERRIAIYDLVEENSFSLHVRDDGQYAMIIALHEAKLAI